MSMLALVCPFAFFVFYIIMIMFICAFARAAVVSSIRTLHDRKCVNTPKHTS